MSGDVRLAIEAWMPERLIQRTVGMGLTLSRVERTGEHSLIVETSARDAERLIALCGRFSIPCRVLARRGRSALTRFLRARWTLLPAVAVALALCWAMLGRLWRIDVVFTGAAAGRGDPAYFIAALDSMGVRPGASNDLDAVRLSGELLAGAADYSFVAARVEGVRLVIEAAPEVPAPEVYDVQAARDLYADRNGIVVSVNVESGAACVSPGDTVSRGQLLIRGEERDADGATRGISALGEVVVRAWYEGSAEGSLKESQLVYTGRSDVSSRLWTPWLSVPIVEGERFDQQAVETGIIPIGGLYVPLCVVRQTARETRWQREEGDRELLSSRLADLAIADARAALARSATEDYRVARSWIRFSLPDGDRLRADAVFEIYTNTAVARKDIPEGG